MYSVYKPYIILVPGNKLFFGVDYSNSFEWLHIQAASLYRYQRPAYKKSSGGGAICYLILKYLLLSLHPIWSGLKNSMRKSWVFGLQRKRPQGCFTVAKTRDFYCIRLNLPVLPRILQSVG